MNEQDEKLLERYLVYIRKRNKIIVIIIIFVLFLVSIGFYSEYAKYKKNIKDVSSFVQQKSESNVINENIIEEKSNENNINIVTDENAKEESTTEEISNDNTIANTKEESANQEIKVETKKNTSITAQDSKPKDTNEKPSNKDFLFTNGYTMDNVTQAAQDYLKSYNYSGECIPIQDGDGIYLGMRVIFY